uniref:Urotensin-2 n=1 Tax=Neovison vison TaxID=452646 RepID=A0A8C7AEU1_NEOVI
RVTNTFHVTPCVTPARTHTSMSCLGHFNSCMTLSLTYDLLLEETLRLSAPDGDTRPDLDELERVSLLQMLLEMSGAERGDGLRKAGLGTNIANTRGSMKKFQDFSGRDPNIFLSHLLARYRKQDEKRGSPSECFWKYCV